MADDTSPVDHTGAPAAVRRVAPSAPSPIRATPEPPSDLDIPRIAGMRQRWHGRCTRDVGDSMRFFAEVAVLQDGNRLLWVRAHAIGPRRLSTPRVELCVPLPIADGGKAVVLTVLPHKRVVCTTAVTAGSPSQGVPTHLVAVLDGLRDYLPRGKFVMWHHGGPMCCCASWLATVGERSEAAWTLRLWSTQAAAAGSRALDFTGAMPLCMAATADELFILGTDAEAVHDVRLTAVDPGEARVVRERRFPADPREVCVAAFLEGAELLVTADARTARVWRTSTLELLATTEDTTGACILKPCGRASFLTGSPAVGYRAYRLAGAGGRRALRRVRTYDPRDVALLAGAGDAVLAVHANGLCELTDIAQDACLGVFDARALLAAIPFAMGPVAAFRTE